MGKRRPLRRADGKPIDHSKMSAGYAAKQAGNRGGYMLIFDGKIIKINLQEK